MAQGISMARYQAWRNLAVMFFDIVDEQGKKPFMWRKVEGKYQPITWREAAEKVSRLSRGLRAIGVKEGDRVVLCAENRPEWLIAELGIMCAGAIPVPAYTTNTPDDHEHIIDNVRARAAIVSTRKLAENLLPPAHESNHCKYVVAMEAPHLSQELGGVEVHLWDEVLAKGDDMPDDARAIAGRLARTDTAVIIHTSGTGGAPKGVMLSHGAILSNCMGGWHRLQDHVTYGREVFLSFLPLSHAYEHMAGQWLATSIAAQIYFAESIDTLVSNMAEVKPTIMTAVPRLYEVIHMRVVKGLQAMPAARQKLFHKALELGRKRYEAPKTLTFGEKITNAILDKLVRRKVQGRFGGRLKFFVSGGAPLNYDIGIFFTALGVKLLQGYGQTEAAPLISVNPAEGTKIHTVGPPVEGVDLHIAEDGEICVKGELLMQGYFDDDESTKAAIIDGWLHTGDIGELDEDGHILITDRKKDLIVNSGGDNISPQRVEGFLTLQPEIGQAMVYGDKRPHLVAIIVPEPDFLKDWAKAHDKKPDLAELSDDSGLHDALGKAVERVNKELAGIERVRRFTIAPVEFTTENEMLTPSMKIRRHVIRREFGAALEGLYERKKGGTAAKADKKSAAE